MKIALINPNSTASMTDKAVAAARAVVPADIELVGITCKDGPPSIQGPEDGEAAIPGLLNEIDQADAAGADGFVIACFDDTGLEQARNMVDKPVVGIAEAAFHASMMWGQRFSVVTTLSVSVPVIEQNIQRYGVGEFCCGVRASEVAVLELEQAGSDAERRISEEIAAAISEDGCGAIVLGCAGMADLVDRLQQQHRILIIDGVGVGAGFVAVMAAAPELTGSRKTVV